jgi:hypothetical protein
VCSTAPPWKIRLLASAVGDGVAAAGGAPAVDHKMALAEEMGTPPESALAAGALTAAATRLAAAVAART